MAGSGDSPGGIVAAAARLDVALDAGQATQLETFVDLLGRWNSRFNLLSRKDMDRIWSRHVLDSLSLLPLLPAVPGSVLDIGSGAGFPGLPLAIASPGHSFLLVDRHQRKVRFLELAAHTLGLVNVRCACCDVAELPDEERFDVIVSRAVAPPADLWAWSRRLLASDGELVLMTGAGGRPSDDGCPSYDGSALESADPSQEGLLAEEGLTLQGAHVAGRCAIEIPGLDRPHEVTIIRAGELEQKTGGLGCRMS